MRRPRRSRYGTPVKSRRLTDAERFLILVQWWKYRREGYHYLDAADMVDTHYISLHKWEQAFGVKFDKKDNSVRVVDYTEIPFDAVLECI